MLGLSPIIERGKKKRKKKEGKKKRGMERVGVLLLLVVGLVVVGGVSIEFENTLPFEVEVCFTPPFLPLFLF